jgi:hypothetical protein
MQVTALSFTALGYTCVWLLLLGGGLSPYWCHLLLYHVGSQAIATTPLTMGPTGAHKGGRTASPV